MGFTWRAANLVVTTYVAAALAPANCEYEAKHLATGRFRGPIAEIDIDSHGPITGP